ncbi:MAG: dihydropteroate synthase [Sphingobacteriales bacterium]|nr:dihydropteroate synthase [Sphingobacteriales bacterium]MBI3717365.1 dihydropteroate synthase [Sphingobacteriales bacterium]
MFTLNCKGKLLTIDRPKVMGILNLTPDSFYSGSRFTNIDMVLKETETMINEGAFIIDIGGQSTRPGSERISATEELGRVMPAIEAIINQFPETIISIDTYQAKVVKEAVAAGVSIVNDISSGDMDNEMMRTVADLRVPYICMHMKGTPATMQQDAIYDDVTKEVLDYFIHKIARCKEAGIHDVIIDPGFGFGKTIQHNFQLLKKMEVLKQLGKPIVAGLSRKSTIYKTLGTTAEEALNGTTALNMIALLNGAAILRVHDVKEAAETIKLFEAYQYA